MHHHLIGGHNRSHGACWQPVLDDMATTDIALVVTWSSGSKAAATGFAGLSSLSAHVEHPTGGIRARVLFVSKGSRCFYAPQQKLIQSCLAHCIDGPNVGAREAHTVIQFCVDFHERPPAAIVFLQDDPFMSVINRVGLTHEFVRTLAASFRSRAMQAHQPPASPTGESSDQATFMRNAQAG